MRYSPDELLNRPQNESKVKREADAITEQINEFYKELFMRGDLLLFYFNSEEQAFSSSPLLSREIAEELTSRGFFAYSNWVGIKVARADVPLGERIWRWVLSKVW